MSPIVITIENRPLCKVDGCPNVVAKVTPKIYRKVCNRHHRGKARGNAAHATQAGRTSGYRPKDAELTRCYRCPFVAEHPVQIEVHHIDGDRTNNSKGNLAHLCCSCHKLAEHYKRHNPEAYAEMSRSLAGIVAQKLSSSRS